MGLIVVDASVAVKWVLQEFDSSVAVALLTGVDKPRAPDLLTVEVAGAIARAFRNRRVDVDEVTAALDAWSDRLRQRSLELVPNDLYLRRAVEISCALLHPLSDCLYLALAERLDADLVTTALTLRRRAAPVWPRVRLLGA